MEAHPADARGVCVSEEGDGTLRVHGNVAHEASCRTALQRWLGRKAHEHLIPLLHQVSRDTGRPFARAGVRHQRTRWASCSRHHSISLNAKLLFLEPELVRCVLIHELCHTREMNHTSRFWGLVEAHCPEFKQHRANLRRAWKALPAWA